MSSEIRTKPSKIWSMVGIVGSIIAIVIIVILMVANMTTIPFLMLPKYDQISTIERMTTAPATRVMNTNDTKTFTIGPNLLVNPGAEGLLSDWIQLETSLAIADLGHLNVGYEPHSGSVDFAGGYPFVGSFSRLLQNVNLIGTEQKFFATEIDSGTLRAEITFYYQNFDGISNRHDAVQVSLQFRSVNNIIIARSSTNELVCSIRPGWCFANYTYPVPVGTRNIDYIMSFIRYTGIGIDSYIDDNSLRII